MGGKLSHLTRGGLQVMPRRQALLYIEGSVEPAWNQPTP